MTPARVVVAYNTGPHALALTLRELDADGVPGAAHDLTGADVVLQIGGPPTADATVTAPLLTLAATVDADPTTGRATVPITAADTVALGFGAFYAQAAVLAPAGGPYTSTVKAAAFHLVIEPGVVN